MAHIDRRSWLKTIGLAVSTMSASRIVIADSPHSAARRGGKRLARLSLNENPYGPALSVVTAVQAELSNLCRYTDVQYGELLTAIAAKEAISKEQIILGEILEPLGTHLSLQGGLGGEFIYSDPGYTALIDSAVASVSFA